MTEQATTTDELAFTRPYGEQEKQILTAEAVEFLTELVTHFTPQRNKLLAARIQQQQDIDNGTLPDFISETASIRDADWKIRGIPADLEDRRVEITGPVERKMVINALNANVKVFMADFEDSLAPDWNKVIDGQINLRDAVNGTISYTNEAGKIYQLKPNPAVLICRVRGLHLPEKHVTWRGEAIPGSLFDFALYFFHNYQALLAKGSGPYFYLPKTQSWQEAAWWSEVFSYAEDRFNLPRGTIKATLLIETLPAVFQQMPMGQLFAVFFFLSVFFAGITSLINMFEAVVESWQSHFNLNRKLAVLLCSAITLGVGLFLEAEPNVGQWMDFITIGVVPIGAVMGAVSVYYVLGWPKLRQELQLGRKKPISAAFGAVGRYVYVPLTILVLILGFALGGIG